MRATSYTAPSASCLSHSFQSVGLGLASTVGLAIANPGKLAVGTLLAGLAGLGTYFLASPGCSRELAPLAFGKLAERVDLIAFVETGAGDVVEDGHLLGASYIAGDGAPSGEAQERGIVGETPNLAARLQGTAEPNTVVIADSTRRLLGNLFDLKDLGAKDLKGLLHGRSRRPTCAISIRHA